MAKTRNNHFGLNKAIAIDYAASIYEYANDQVRKYVALRN